MSEKQADAAVLQGLIEYVELGAFEAWLDEVVREDEATRRSGKPMEVVELEADVRKQEGRVEKVGRTLLDVGASDYLKSALKQEEDRLRELRQKLAAAVQRQPPQRRSSTWRASPPSCGTSPTWLPPTPPRRVA